MTGITDAVSRTCDERIEGLRRTKSAHTDEKVRRRGFFDIDDHGWVPWDEPIPFTPVSNHPDGGCYGARCLGENFRRWLQVHPVYIHPDSALAGAWVQGPPGLGGWRPEDRPVHLRELHQKYNILYTGIGGMNHCGPDMQIGLDLGWGGLLERLRRYRALNRPQDPSFYDGEEALVLGVQEWIGRHVTHARELAASETAPERRENYLEIAAMNERLIDGPPRTLREACQFLAWFQSLDRMWGCGGALGQLDELLRPFYEADRAAGRVTDDEAIWCVASLFFNDTHYSQIGGPAPADGRDLTSPISFLILEAMHRLRIPINIAVRVHDGLNPELLRRSIEYLFADGTGCCYSCARGLDEGYARNGVPLSVARMRAKVGCNWTALPGIEYCLQDVTRMCLGAPFLHAFREVAAGPGEPSMEALWDRYVHHLGVAVDTIKRGFDWHMRHHSRNSPEIVLNLFMHGTVERGLDMAEGGVDIYRLTCDGVGLATVADSFAAVEQRVVGEGRLTWQELAGHLERSFESAENVRLMLRGVPRFGTGKAPADGWARRVGQLYTDLMRNSPTPDGYTVLPGLFSHGIVGQLGRGLGATPNGRRAGEPISHSANPDPGFMADGGAAPTAKSNAVAAVQPGWGNSAPLQLDLDSHLSHELGGIEAVEALITGHEELGGTLININVVSREQVLEAHADPSKYPDLVVRVTGYSAYFQTLSPEYRQQIVDRLLAET
ncbi:MAG: pyruvate formate lyase family protein [Candidatus Latescibacterota bacterium]|jgi:formate C-acetyltransferase